MSEDLKVDLSLPAKEIIEGLEALRVLGVFGVKVGADKKVNAADLPHLIELSGKINVIAEGARGLDEVPAHWKELSETDLAAILGKVFAIARDLRKAGKAAVNERV